MPQAPAGETITLTVSGHGWSFDEVVTVPGRTPAVVSEHHPASDQSVVHGSRVPVAVQVQGDLG